jgi:hypothetical protein
MFVILALVLAMSVQAGAQVQTVFELSRTAAVHLWVRDWDSLKALCSAGWVSIQGVPHILTAAHCMAFEGSGGVVVTTDRRTFVDAELVAMGWKRRSSPEGGYGVKTSATRLPSLERLQSADFSSWDTSGGDWAVLKTSAKPPSRVPDLSKGLTPSLGSQVFFTGFPAGGDAVTVPGTVASPEYRIPSDPVFDRLILLDARVTFGNSGSVILDGHGRAVGIVVAVLSTPQTGWHLGLATPASKVTLGK